MSLSFPALFDKPCVPSSSSLSSLLFITPRSSSHHDWSQCYHESVFPMPLCHQELHYNEFISPPAAVCCHKPVQKWLQHLSLRNIKGFIIFHHSTPNRFQAPVSPKTNCWYQQNQQRPDQDLQIIDSLPGRAVDSHKCQSSWSCHVRDWINPPCSY